jgi:hypothetical protein
MISFRVSAEDAQILAKQFEPQFEAQDLLQMHNRHFIINMVINGEKTPAFSATTLTLPPPQVDNSKFIIENSRAIYSRSRADVESSISDLIKPPEELQPKPKAKPQPPAPAATTNLVPPAVKETKAPLPAPATPAPRQLEVPEVAGQLTVSNTPTSMLPASSPIQDKSATPAEGEPKKKRRPRRRKRKTATSNESQVTTQQPETPPSVAKKQTDDAQGELRIR